MKLRLALTLAVGLAVCLAVPSYVVYADGCSVHPHHGYTVPAPIQSYNVHHGHFNHHGHYGFNEKHIVETPVIDRFYFLSLRDLVGEFKSVEDDEPQPVRKKRKRGKRAEADQVAASPLATLLQDRCVSCHGNAGGVSLEDPDSLDSEARSRVLLRAALGEMPPKGDKLTSDELKVLAEYAKGTE